MDDSPIVKANVPLLKELVALSGLAQGNTLSLLDYTKALPSVLLCLCPDVLSWKIFPILSKISHFNLQSLSEFITLSSLLMTLKFCFSPTPYGIYLFSLLLTWQFPLMMMLYVSFYWCLPCARHCVKYFPCIISFKSLNNLESYMLLLSPFFI